MTRNEAREIMMQTMYEIDINDLYEQKIVDEMLKNRLRGNHAERGILLFSNIVARIAEIDEMIEKNSRDWKISRLPRVDLAIMRLAVGEILFCDDIPYAVSINEAVKISHKYSTGRSARFINGVLGAIVKSYGKE